ncbi:MAG TPA: hypothetical protein QF813_04275, partial [Alphaproteobacteria bacterium]|nr:hypothetical protein [Alphaproteobacteria bacterium]
RINPLSATCASLEDERLTCLQQHCAAYGFGSRTTEMAGRVQNEKENYRSVTSEERASPLED